MLNDINLKDFPKESGVYLFKVDEEVVYVGSSKNLYRRMCCHRESLRKGSDHGYKEDFYQFLKTNQFKIEYTLEEDYRQLEQELLEKHNPKYNNQRAYTGCGAARGREVEWRKEYRRNFPEIKRADEKYKNKKCNYNNEILSLDALAHRFKRRGFTHPFTEAKKYLIS